MPDVPCYNYHGERRKPYSIELDMRLKMIFTGPGKYLLLMTSWIFVFFVICLCSYPVIRFLTSYLAFFIPLALTLIFSLFLNLADSTFAFWKRIKSWGKLGILLGSYTSVVITSLIITLVLSDHGMIDYFDGDPEGSFGMLYIPSIIFYTISGTVLVIARRRRRRKNESEQIPS